MPRIRGVCSFKEQPPLYVPRISTYHAQLMSRLECINQMSEEMTEHLLIRPQPLGHLLRLFVKEVEARLQPTRMFGLEDWGEEKEEEFPGGLAEQGLYLESTLKEQGTEFQQNSCITGRFGVQGVCKMDPCEIL